MKEDYEVVGVDKQRKIVFVRGKGSFIRRLNKYKDYEVVEVGDIRIG